MRGVSGESGLRSYCVEITQMTRVAPSTLSTAVTPPDLYRCNCPDKRLKFTYLCSPDQPTMTWAISHVELAIFDAFQATVAIRCPQTTPDDKHQSKIQWKIVSRELAVAY
jgi:hypothetical protein